MIGCAKKRQEIEDKGVNPSSTKGLSDAEIMRRLADGETAALGELYLRHGALTAHAALAADPSLSRQDVEDLCQDVFLIAAESAAKYREEGKLRAWLYSIAVRTARKRRRTRRVRELLLFSAKGKPVAASGPAPLPETSAMIRMDLYSAFEGLTEIQRQTLILFELEGMSGEEISETLGIRLNTVWSHLRRARNRVLEVFKDSKGLTRAGA